MPLYKFYWHAPLQTMLTCPFTNYIDTPLYKLYKNIDMLLYKLSYLPLVNLINILQYT